MQPLKVIGNNAVGRMYRLTKLTSSKERGFILQTKYRSNYGGNPKKISFKIILESNPVTRNEHVKLTVFTDEPIRVAVSSEEFKKYKKNVAITLQSEREVGSIREIVKPDYYNIGQSDYPVRLRQIDGILYFDLVINSTNEDERDSLMLAIYPSVVKEEEYIVVHGECKTPIMVENENGIKYI